MTIKIAKYTKMFCLKSTGPKTGISLKKGILIDLKIENIKINVFYLKEKIQQFIKDKNFPVKIEVIEDGETILGTGGGTLNLINSTDENDVLVDFDPRSGT